MRRGSLSLLMVIGLVLTACGGDGASGGGLAGLGTAKSAAEQRSSENARSTTTTAAPSSSTTTTRVAPTTVPSSTGLRATVEEARLFAVRRQLALQLKAEGPADVAITTVRLSSPLFDLIEPMPRDITVHVTQPRVSMPLSYGAARCTEPGAEPSMVEVTIGGAVERLPLDQPSIKFLNEVRHDECAVRLVGESVELRFGDTWERTGDREVSGQLVVTAQQSGAKATLDDLRSGIVFSIFADGEPPLAEVDGDTAEDTVDVRIVASRCDPHALTESARKYIFTSYISVDGEKPQPVEFRATGAAQQAFNSLLADC